MGREPWSEPLQSPSDEPDRATPPAPGADAPRRFRPWRSAALSAAALLGAALIVAVLAAVL
jgi:hypothetical protein